MNYHYNSDLASKLILASRNRLTPNVYYNVYYKTVSIKLISYPDFPRETETGGKQCKSIKIFYKKTVNN